MNATPPPDPDALAWLDAHLAQDEAALLEALPDPLVHAELRELGLDPARLTLPPSRPMPARPGQRLDRAAQPRVRTARPPWLYAAASLLLVVVASLVVLRDVPDAARPQTSAEAVDVPKSVPAPLPSGKAPLGPAPQVDVQVDALADAREEGSAGTSAPPNRAPRAVVKAAPVAVVPRAEMDAFGSVAAEAASDAPMASPPLPSVMAGVPPSAAKQAARLRAAPPAPDTVDEALRKAEGSDGEAPVDSSSVLAASLRTAISVLTRAYEADPAPAEAIAPRRKRIAAALAQAYTALGDAESARHWAQLAQLP